MDRYDGRLSGLEKKVDHLDDKMNKGLSLMAAMNAVDFQNVQTGEMALGAGIGHYGNAQSVALGVAYAPVEDLTVNAKYLSNSRRRRFICVRSWSNLQI